MYYVNFFAEPHLRFCWVIKLLASQQKKSQLEYLKSKAGVLIKQAGPPDNKPGSKT